MLKRFTAWRVGLERIDEVHRRGPWPGVAVEELSEEGFHRHPGGLGEAPLTVLGFEL